MVICGAVYESKRWELAAGHETPKYTRGKETGLGLHQLRLTNQMRIKIDMTINQKQHVMVRKLQGLIRIEIFLYRGQHKIVFRIDWE